MKRSRDTTYNFSPGPATLPTSVLQRAAEETLDWHGSNMSVMEMSHRGSHFISILKKTEKDLRTLLDVPNNYKVLFTQGGATGQFAAIPLNLLGDKPQADYLVTGNWSEKAAEEASKYGTVNLVATNKNNKYTVVPDSSEWKIDNSSAYFHYCDNETVHGLEFPANFVPSSGLISVPIVADMSSNFFSRPVDVSKYGVIYGGAQKNIGIAGLTIVIVREDLLELQKPKYTPTIFDWKKMAESDSCYNTPPCHSIYMAGLCFEWLLELGGLEGIAAINQRKSDRLYDFIDSHPYYSCPVKDKRFRSRMNVDFKIGEGNPALEEKFAKEAEERGLLNLKGYRTVGGMRASLYNAMTEVGVDHLVEFMQEFEEKNEAK